ncbi:MAG: hypothetical protein A2052_07810 [Deltaproteobacteria bacterium GWA2_54_12]|nr:MAG: hypothetical protein A2052_07810 [Deltaproteobacteria bacterium GWA2_54_12]
MIDFRNFTRKKIMIRPAYQMRLAVRFSVSIILYSFILGLVIFYPLYQDLNAAATIEEQTLISSVVLYLHKSFWPGFILVALLAGLQAIVSSHRLVGPMYRFEKMVQELISGNYSLRIKIRKRDEFKEMEGFLNRLAGTLEEAKTRDNQFYHDARIKLETIKAMLEAEGAEYPADVKRLAQELIYELDARDAYRAR